MTFAHNPANLQELADSLAAVANSFPFAPPATDSHMGYRTALLDVRATVLAMIAAAEVH
jgi:hypothetical protein